MVDHKDEIRRMLDEQRNDSYMQIEHHFRNTAKELHLAKNPFYGAHNKGWGGGGYYRDHHHGGAGYPYHPYAYHPDDPNLLNMSLSHQNGRTSSSKQYDDFELKDGHIYR